MFGLSLQGKKPEETNLPSFSGVVRQIEVEREDLLRRQHIYIPELMGPKHTRRKSALGPIAPGTRHSSDEDYIYMLNSCAFDFKASSLSDVSLIGTRKDQQRCEVKETHRRPSIPPPPPPSISSITPHKPSLRPFLPQLPTAPPPGPWRLNTSSTTTSSLSSTTQAPELDTSSASVTPVSPRTPPSFLHLTSSLTAPEILNSKPQHHLSLPSILPTPSPPTTTTTTIRPNPQPDLDASLSSTIHSLFRLGFAYIPEIHSLICLHCTTKPRILYRGILRSHLRKHISEPSFQSLICELEHLVTQLPSFAKSIEEVPRRQCGRPALPYLPVLQGFRCLLCDFCAVSSRYVDNHWGEKHKGAPRPSLLYAPASLQTLGGSRQLTRLFWVV